MACLWVQDDEGWAVMPLDGEAFIQLTAGRAIPAHRQEGNTSDDGNAGKDGAFLACQRNHSAETWTLVAASAAGVKVNGEALLLGIRVLKDRDAIRVGSGPVRFLVTERQARVESCEEGEASLTCPRCRQVITPGTPIVRCPQCGVAHHQSTDLPCWTGYENEPFSTCALGDHPATLDGGFRWTPAEL